MGTNTSPEDEDHSDDESVEENAIHSLPSADDEEEKIELCNPEEFIGTADQGSEDDNDGLIGQTTPPPPPTAERKLESTDSDNAEEPEPNQLRKLTPEKAAQIRSSLINHSDDKASPEDASKYMTEPDNGHGVQNRATYDQTEKTGKQKDNSEPEDKTPSGSDFESAPVIEMEKSPSVRRIAYYHKNFIQLSGTYQPSSGEELIVGENYFLLKPKKIKQQYTIGAFSILLVILLFVVGKQFISPTLPGNGSIIGVIVDEKGELINSRIEVSLPEAGEKVITDALGFFRFSDIPTGTYVVRYTEPGGIVGTQNITVVDNQVATITLGTEPTEITAIRNYSRNSRPETKSRYTPPPVNETRSDAAEVKTAPKKFSALRLKANIDGARLIAGGKTLGVGNLTYRKLKPGKHKVKVTKDGYKSWSGTVNLKPDETYSLKVTLEKIQTAAVEPTYTAEDFYQSARTVMAESNYPAAVDDFTEAIILKPSMADAYLGRAEANMILGKKNAAEIDFIRAGEIYVSQKRYEAGADMFNRVIQINRKSMAALINIGSLHWRLGNKREAVETYKTALKLDKNSFRINYDLGKIYYALGKNKDADKRLRKARDIDRSVPEVYHYLMLNYFARDDFGKVKKTYGEFKSNTTEDQVQAFKRNPRHDAIIRIVGEYERP